MKGCTMKTFLSGGMSDDVKVALCHPKTDPEFVMITEAGGDGSIVHLSVADLIAAAKAVEKFKR